MPLNVAARSGRAEENSGQVDLDHNRRDNGAEANPSCIRRTHPCPISPTCLNCTLKRAHAGLRAAGQAPC